MLRVVGRMTCTPSRTSGGLPMSSNGCSTWRSWVFSTRRRASTTGRMTTTTCTAAWWTRVSAALLRLGHDPGRGKAWPAAPPLAPRMHSVASLQHPPQRSEFRPIYFRTLQQLLDTTFSTDQFNTLLDQTLAIMFPPTSFPGSRPGWTAACLRPVPDSSRSASVVRPPVATLTVPRALPLRCDRDLHRLRKGVTHYRFPTQRRRLRSRTPGCHPDPAHQLAHRHQCAPRRRTRRRWAVQAETSATVVAWIVNPAGRRSLE